MPEVTPKISATTETLRASPKPTFMPASRKGRVEGITMARNFSPPPRRYTSPISRSRRSTCSTPSTMFEATTGSVIMKVVKIGAQFERPNQMIEMTIQTKTEVELRTARASWTTPRASRERNAASPMRTATSTAPPKPTRMRASEAPVCVHTSPEPTMSAKPRTTESGEGSRYAPWRQERSDQTATISAIAPIVGKCSLVPHSRWFMAAFERGLCPRNLPLRGEASAVGRSPPPRLHPVEELAADPVRAVPEVRLEEAELLVDLELRDERVHLLLGQAVEHPDGLLVGDLDHVRRQLGDLLDDLDRARGPVVPDVHRVPLRVVEVSRDRRVLLEELVVHEVADVHREPCRPARGLPP